MFGFGKKRNYEERIRSALSRGDFKEAERVARDAFADTKSEEHILAWVGAAMYEQGIDSALDLLEVFVNRYPDSLHLPRVYLADVLSRASRFDQATNQARCYLRLAKDAGVFPDLGTKRIIQDGVSRSFLLLTSAYTTLGARSYSRRALEYGLQYELAAKWKEMINNELNQLERELQTSENKQLDLKWEKLFSSGLEADDLYKQCIDSGFPIMAKRVDLLEGNFRFNAAFKVDLQEMFFLVLETEGKESLLR